MEVTDVGARVKRNGTYTKCTITVRPLAESADCEGLMLVLLEERSSGQVQENMAIPTNEEASTLDVDSDNSLVNVLEFELKTTQAELQDSIQQMGLSHEELQSSNEEMQSSNEELQSSKEELQSLNEEMNTVNCLLLEKVAELDQSNCEISNLMASTEIAILFLDKQLRIKRLTSPAIELFEPVVIAVNQTLHELQSPLVDPEFIVKCQEFIAGGEMFRVAKRCRNTPWKLPPMSSGGLVWSCMMARNKN